MECGFQSLSNGCTFAESQYQGIRHGDRLQPGRTKTIYRNRRRRDRQAGVQRGNARDIVALDSVGLAAAENYVFDFVGIDLRSFAENVLDAMRGEILGPRHIEGAAK